MMNIPCSVIVVAAMLSGSAEALKMALPPSHGISFLTRARFLSTFVASSSFAWTYAQEECSAASPGTNANPRYIDQELQMKYGENKGARDQRLFCSFLFDRSAFHKRKHSLNMLASALQGATHALEEFWFVA